MKIIDDQGFSVVYTENCFERKVTIVDLHTSLCNIFKKNITNELDQWIQDTEFFKTIPFEMYANKTCAQFAGYLSAYQSGVTNFLKENSEFYLTQ